MRTVSPVVIDHTALEAIFNVSGSNFDKLENMYVTYNVVVGGEVDVQSEVECNILSATTAEADVVDIPSEGMTYNAVKVSGVLSGTEIVLWEA